MVMTAKYCVYGDRDMMIRRRMRRLLSTIDVVIVVCYVEVMVVS